MPERGNRSGRTTTPEQFAETLPPEVAPTHSFSIQAIFELQRAFGKVEQSVTSLEKRVEDQGKTLKTIERLIFVATGAFLVISTLIGLAIKYGLDMLTQLLAKP
jgi:hypothetical protein